MKLAHTSHVLIFLLALCMISDVSEDFRVENKVRYGQLIQAKKQQRITHTGPDKANIRDFLMTVDIEKGYVPKERLLVTHKNLQSARVSNGKDFGWENVSTEIAGRSRAFVYSSNNQKLLAGGVTGGLWRTDDFKSQINWQNIEGLTHSSISSIAVDPQNDQVIYVGTGESFTAFVNYRESSSVGSGLWKSTDGGSSWTQLSSTLEFAYINDIVIRVENNQSVVYAGVASGEYETALFTSDPSNGLYRSSDGGSTWSQVLPNIPGEQVPYAVADIELAEDNRLYVGTMRNLENKGGGILLSSSDASNWEAYTTYDEDTQNISAGTSNPYYSGRVVVKSAPSNPEVVYAIFMRGLNNSLGQLRDYADQVELRVSRNGGQTFSVLETPFRWATIPWHAAALGIDPNDENVIMIGGLHVHYLPNSSGVVTASDWIQVSDGTVFSFVNPNLSEEERDSLTAIYVHPDIHDIQFINNSSDEVLICTDGGLYYSGNIADAVNYNSVSEQSELPVFLDLNKGFVTTQYYTIALHPDEGDNRVLAGTQDNGTIINRRGQLTSRSDFVSGGDGAFCFWDKNNPEVYLSSAQSNAFFITLNDVLIRHHNAYSTGYFINPTDYDWRSNLLYANASNGRYGGLFDYQNQYLDSLLILNVNKFLGTDDLGRDTLSFVGLNAGSTEPFTAVKVSEYSQENNATIFVGTNMGDVYRTQGLPDNPVSTLISSNQMPVGYISSIDIGENENSIVVTFSNYGVESIWVTYDGGANWANIERNLPDIPVRWALFNPYDDDKVMIATELGVWGLENVKDKASEWVQYNDGMPSIRVDMIKVRKSDSAIAAATHGRGIYFGKFDQGDRILGAEYADKPVSQIKIYPNPANNRLFIQTDASKAHTTAIFDLQGKLVSLKESTEGYISVKELSPGLYVLRLMDTKESLNTSSKFLIAR